MTLRRTLPVPFLLLAACAAPPRVPGIALDADNGLREVRIEALGIE